MLGITGLLGPHGGLARKALQACVPSVKMGAFNILGGQSGERGLWEPPGGGREAPRSLGMERFGGQRGAAEDRTQIPALPQSPSLFIVWARGIAGVLPATVGRPCLHQGLTQEGAGSWEPWPTSEGLSLATGDEVAAPGIRLSQAWCVPLPAPAQVHLSPDPVVGGWGGTQTQGLTSVRSHLFFLLLPPTPCPVGQPSLS